MQSSIKQILSDFPHETIVQTLKPFLTENKIGKIESLLDKRIGSIQLALESPSDIHNALAVVRSAEAFGYLHTHIISEEKRRNRGRRTTMGAIHWIQLHDHRSLDEFFSKQELNMQYAGACTDADMTLEDIDVRSPICLLFGNEHRGLSPQAKNRCDFLFKIPMYGMSESLNLSVASSICMYQLTQKKRELLKGKRDLNQANLLQEKARCYVRCLGIKTALPILKAKTVL